MATTYFLGVDGGGTGCRARLTDADGRVLGEGVAGPGNLALGMDIVFTSIMDCAMAAIASAGLDRACLGQIRAGLGMAAANADRHRQALEKLALPFKSVAICSDAESACLGAHQGENGAILILGTGSHGVAIFDGRVSTVGGWGFQVSDCGSGATLGRAAIRRALLALEGIEEMSPLCSELMESFGNRPEILLEWAERARPRDWAAFAPQVFHHCAQGDPVALALAAANARAAERLLRRLLALGSSRIALMGGIAPVLRPFLDREFDRVLVAPAGDALDGALLLAMRH